MLARPGHVIVCYGNCHKLDRNNNKPGPDLDGDDGGGGGGSSSSGSIHVTPISQRKQKDERDDLEGTAVVSGETLMKRLWVDMYNRAN